MMKVFAKHIDLKDEVIKKLIFTAMKRVFTKSNVESSVWYNKNLKFQDVNFIS